MKISTNLKISLTATIFLSSSIFASGILDRKFSKCDHKGKKYLCSKNIYYGEDRELDLNPVSGRYNIESVQNYDLWLPLNHKSTDKRKLVVFIHGGGYHGGTKDLVYKENPKTGIQDKDAGMQQFLDEGYAFATINYRLSGSHPYKKSKAMPYPIFMKDAGQAIQHMRMLSSQTGIDPTKVALTGWSAGGGISLWLALHDDLKKTSSGASLLDQQSTRVSCAAVYGTQTTLNIAEIKSLFGPAFKLDNGVPGFYGIESAEEYNRRPGYYQKLYLESMREASPITHISSDDRNVKILLTYTKGYKELNIHSPEFGRYMSEGKPTMLAKQMNRKSLTSKGIPHVFEESKRRPTQRIFDYVTKQCFN